MKINNLFVLISLNGVLCGDSRIINGNEAVPFSYPFVASLQRNNSHICGGSILNKNTILTAAHCSVFDPAILSVQIHRHDLRKQVTEEKGVRIGVKSIHSHPKYDPQRFTSDVSVWKLQNDIPTNIYYETITLDTQNLGLMEGLQTTVIGWGRINTYDNVLSPVLKEALLPVYNFNNCSQSYLNTLKQEHHVCAGYYEGVRSPCNGDSGSPLFIKKSRVNFQVGIVSFASSKYCLEPRTPAVFSRVNTYIGFIQSIINTK